MTVIEHEPDEEKPLIRLSAAKSAADKRARETQRSVYVVWNAYQGVYQLASRFELGKRPAVYVADWNSGD